MITPMSNYPPLLSDLSDTQQQLVLLMQSVGYGSIESLHVFRGEPVFDPAPKVIREVKLGAGNESRHQPQKDYRLKLQVLDLLDQLLEIGDGVVQSISVKGGLPFTILYQPVSTKPSNTI